MKKLQVFIILILLNTTAYAQISHLRLAITSPSKINQYFICLPDAGCFSVLSAKRGQDYPLLSGKLNGLMAANLQSGQMSMQSIPASCRVNVVDNQTLVISGRLIAKAKGLAIANLQCRVTK